MWDSILQEYNEVQLVLDLLVPLPVEHGGHSLPRGYYGTKASMAPGLWSF